MISWLNTLPKTINEDMKDLIRDLFDRMITPLLNFIRKGGAKVLNDVIFVYVLLILELAPAVFLFLYFLNGTYSKGGLIQGGL